MRALCLILSALACVSQARTGLQGPQMSPWGMAGDLPSVEEMSLAPQREVEDALLLHPVTTSGLQTSSGMPWDETITMPPGQCDEDGEARDLAVIRLVWAEREFVPPKKAAYRYKEGEVIRAPTYNAPCAYRLVHRIEEPDVSTSSNQAGIFVRHNEKTGKDVGPVVLVFRGSAMDLSMDAVKDWVNNLRILPRTCKLPSGRTFGKCHSGFLHGLKSMESAVSPLKLTRQLADEIGAREILVGGSSLGAAMATLAALDLTQTQSRPVKLITHGSPRVGNSELAKAVNKNLAYSARYVAVSPCTEESLRVRGRDTTKASDVVTRMPFRSMGYRHIKGAKVVACLTPCRKTHNPDMSFFGKMYSKFVTAISNALKGEDHESRPNLMVSFKCHLAYTKALWHMYGQNQRSPKVPFSKSSPFVSYMGPDYIPRMTSYTDLASAIVDDIVHPKSTNVGPTHDT